METGESFIQGLKSAIVITLRTVLVGGREFCWERKGRVL